VVPKALLPPEPALSISPYEIDPISF